MNILILGAGGIGGYFGAHLIRAGASVTYLLRDKRKARIDTQGLRVETPQGAFVVRPRTITAKDVQPEYTWL
jgi:2-dehydropantoate 2-reductase